MSSLPDLPPDLRPDAIVFIRDGGELPRYHVRDQEALTAALPPSPVAPADRAALSPARLDPYPATVWLPDLGAAGPRDGPDPPWSRGWEWPTREWLMIVLHRFPDLPRLRAVGGHPSGSACVWVAGRPMALDVPPPNPAMLPEPEAPEQRFAYTVSGYLDDATHFWADLDAPTPEQRDRLLAALLTLELDRTAAPDAARRTGA